MKTAPTEAAVKGAAVQRDGNPNILALGLAIGAIVAADALLLLSGGRLSAAHTINHRNRENEWLMLHRKMKRNNL